jgi:hypothetical protein
MLPPLSTQIPLTYLLFINKKNVGLNKIQVGRYIYVVYLFKYLLKQLIKHFISVQENRLRVSA